MELVRFISSVVYVLMVFIVLPIISSNMMLLIPINQPSRCNNFQVY